MSTRGAAAWLFALGLLASAQPARGAEESRRVELGRPFHYRFTLEHGENEALQRPLRPSLPASFELLSIDAEPLEGKGSEVDMLLALFDYRQPELPSFELPIEGEHGALRVLSSPALPLTVRSVLDAPSPLTPTRGMRGLVREGSEDSLVSTRSLVVGLCALLLAYFFWWLRARARWSPLPSRQQERASVSRRPPSDEALAAIETLEASSAIEEEDAKPALIRLSAILRRYLARSLEGGAEGRSGEELRAALDEHEGEEGEWGRQMADWISRCERTRYSGAGVSPDDAREFLYEARRLLQSDEALDRRREASRG